jgi:hypothetical protein
MEIKELENLDINVGAPLPIVIWNERDAFVRFFTNNEKAIIVKFKSADCRFGSPGDETISGHPYYKIGMESYSFYELINSDWIDQIIKIDSIHPSHNPERWKDYKHYILTFHDSIFECIAKGFEVKEDDSLLYGQIDKYIKEN